MSNIPPERKVFSLADVMLSVQRTLSARYTSAFWVKAEMNKLNYYKHSGHCYPDLVEKAEGKVVAETRGILWSSDYQRINRKFLQILKEPLKDGIKILFSAKIIFDPRYGLSLQILDIDTSFTLGDLEREKQESIQILQAEDLFDRNKKLPFPLLPKRIAIISVETSKGYADFLNVTDNNPRGYKFSHHLFPSLLQGDRAAASIAAQLNNIRNMIAHFDVVAIIRGGGGEVGISCYNNLELARAVCEFPIPVLTGIGHATNETVTEMVAHTNAITPTKLAEYLIQHFHNFSFPVEEACQIIRRTAAQILADARQDLRNTTRLFKSVTSRAIAARFHEIQDQSRQVGQHALILTSESRQQIRDLSSRVDINSRFLLKNKVAALEALEKNVHNLHPENVLKRGYSITLNAGKMIADAALLKSGTEVETILATGTFKSTVTSTKNKTLKHE